MKKIKTIVGMAFLMLYIHANSQYNYFEIFPNKPNSNDTITVCMIYWYNVGDGFNGPPLVGQIFTFENNNIELSLIHDARGYWNFWGYWVYATSVLEPLSTGDYYLRVRLKEIIYSGDTTSGVVMYDSVKFTVHNTAGFPEQDVLKTVSVYPNPASDYVIFGIDPTLLAAYPLHDYPDNGIQIYNLMGQKVEEIELKEPETIWNCSEVKPGVYFFRLKIGGKQSTGKVVVR
jgi:hypothetical protein